MKLPTFRLRITLLSSALATITLIGFGIVSWLQIYHANLERLDAQIVNLLMRGNSPPKNKVRNLKKFYRDQKWELYANSLDDILGSNARNATGLLILDPQGNSIYQSSEITIDPDLFALIIKQLTETKAPPPRPIRPPRPDPRKSPPPPPPIPLNTQSTKTGTWRIGTVKFPHLQLAIAVNHQVIQQEMATVSQIFLISVLGIFILIAISSWFLSRSVLYPINQLTNTIQQVSVKGLDRRIPLEEIDVEFRELVQVFNQMMERLERSFNQSSRFSADAAHELKTPLTILQGELERMLHQVENGSEIQQSLGNLLDETISLSGIMRKLLLLSLADAGQLSLYLVEVNISELLWQMLEDLELLAPHLELRTNTKSDLRR